MKDINEILKIYPKYIDVFNKINEMECATIAIDGRCASGKSNLAEILSNTFNLNVFHIDDFFLPKELRTVSRLEEIGGNFDRERFLNEVLIPLKEMKDVIYRPFDCSKMEILDGKLVKYKRLNIIEGSYSMHPYIRDYYDLSIFLDIDYITQLERIKKRNPLKYEIFKDKWIPLEEKYFKEFKIDEICDLYIK